MNELPRLDLDAVTADEVRRAFTVAGAALVHDAALPTTRCCEALADAAAFFALPPEQKLALDIGRSPHFRGYSTMHNERDWREQIHFGRETAAAGHKPPFLGLQGPNLWPADSAWRRRMLEYLAAVNQVGQRVLARIAESMGLPRTTFVGTEEPYLLMKLICYHPQPEGAPRRQGVAAHLDFSWITLTLQDDTGGLEVQTPDGRWLAVPPTPGAWLVNLGELLQYATRNTFLATPHRVVNPSTQRARLSIPVFLNPGLHARVAPLAVPEIAPPASQDRPHVHHVLDARQPPEPFGFGEAEWQRKGHNVWCRTCVPAVTSPAAPSRG